MNLPLMDADLEADFPSRSCGPTAKNVALAGVKSLTVHDDGLATLEDLSTQVRSRARGGWWAPCAGH